MGVTVLILTLIYALIAIFLPPNIWIFTILFFASIYAIYISIISYIETLSMELKKLDSLASGAKGDREFSVVEFRDLSIKILQIRKRADKTYKKKRKYIAKIKLKNRQRSNIISAIAHEFRNPISSIMGYAQTINEDDNIPPPLRKKFLNKIYSNGYKIERLLSRLILWNRFESGSYQLQISRFNIGDLTKEVVLSIEDRYRDRDIIILDRGSVVKGDRTLIEIVIYNLIENALKYSSDTVYVDIEESKVSIRDSGIGISSENIDKITKKFFRVDENSWDNSMGLGLAIVQQILILHKSRLEIESREHIGSLFSFKL